MTPTMQNPAMMPNPIAAENPAAKTSFLKGLFGFDNFIADRLVKIIYAVGAALILLVTIGGGLLLALTGLYKTYHFYYSFPEYSSFSGVISSLFFIVLQALTAIVACVLGILLLRLYCELILAIFKINENLQVLRNRN